MIEVWARVMDVTRGKVEGGGEEICFGNQEGQCRRVWFDLIVCLRRRAISQHQNSSKPWTQNKKGVGRVKNFYKTHTQPALLGVNIIYPAHHTPSPPPYVPPSYRPYIQLPLLFWPFILKYPLRSIKWIARKETVNVKNAHSSIQSDFKNLFSMMIGQFWFFVRKMRFLQVLTTLFLEIQLL